MLSESDISLVDKKGEPFSKQIGKTFPLPSEDCQAMSAVIADGTVENYQKMKMDLIKPEYADNSWNRSKVKESEWPVELFYNKTVNTFKKKQ